LGILLHFKVFTFCTINNLDITSGHHLIFSPGPVENHSYKYTLQPSTFVTLVFPLLCTMRRCTERFLKDHETNFADPKLVNASVLAGRQKNTSDKCVTKKKTY